MTSHFRIAAQVALLAFLAGAGCATPSARITLGQVYATGNAPFDQFFNEVCEVRTEALAAEGAERASHAPLIQALGLEPQTPSAEAVDVVAARAKKLRDAGVLLHLEITPEPKLLVAKGRSDLGPEGDVLLKSMEGAARTSLDTRKRLAELLARTRTLMKRRIELRAEAPAAFRAAPQARRDDIIVELDAAAEVLAHAADAADQVAGAASKFAIELAQAVETGAEQPGRQGHAAAPPRKQGQAVAGPPPVKRPAPSAASPPAAAPPAAAPPHKKPKGGDDFEP